MPRPHHFLCILLGGLTTPALAANQFNDFEDAPFSYHTAEKHDPFSELQRAVKAGKVQLAGGSPTIFLRSLLAALKIPAESQTLVFSKTAFQRKVVSSENLRAVYFNDDVYMTYIPGGRIEVASTDPTLGSVFSIFDPTGGPGLPKIESLRNCLGCHAGSFTNFLPGPMLRTVVSDSEGHIVFDYPENNAGHAVAFKDRWGSWIVRGAPPAMAHLGNLVAEQKDGKWEPSKVKFSTDEPVDAFCKKCDLPAQGSDVIGLLVLDHQVAAHNKIIDAGYRWRHALDKLNEKRQKAGEPAVTHLDESGLASAQEWTRKLQTYLTFADEAALPAAVASEKSAFAKVFQETGRAGRKRSLRDLALTDHLFRYRLSYMVHGLSFQGWPLEYQHFFWNQLKTDFATAEAFPHLKSAEKEEILSVARETVSNLPAGY